MPTKPEDKETYLGQPRLPYLNPQENPNGQVKPQEGGDGRARATPRKGGRGQPSGAEGKGPDHRRLPPKNA